MPKIKNITDLEQELFDTVYAWGRFGVLTDSMCETFQEMIAGIKQDAIYQEKRKVYGSYPQANSINDD